MALFTGVIVIWNDMEAIVNDYNDGRDDEFISTLSISVNLKVEYVGFKIRIRSYIAKNSNIVVKVIP